MQLRRQFATRDALKKLKMGLADPASADETRSSPNHCSRRLLASKRALPPCSHSDSSILHAAAATASTDGNASSTRKRSRLLMSAGDAIPASSQHSNAAAF